MSPLRRAGACARFESTAPFSGMHDPRLDILLNRAQAVVNRSQRCGYYHQAAACIARQAYGPFCFTPAGASSRPGTCTVRG